MSLRAALYALLVLVAAAAAVLSFAALRDLAVMCGFATSLAWLLPVVVDAGAAAGSLAWLGRVPGRALAFGRTLALVLLASSVAGNALGHALAAYGARPHWGVVVAVSAVAPAVLGAVVHLAVLAGRPDHAEREDDSPVGEMLEDGRQVVDELAGGTLVLEDGEVVTPEPWECQRDRLLREGAGRSRLAAELGISEWEARQLIAAHREGRQEAPA